MDAGFWYGLPVCVLGGTGFLGHHLIRALIERGARVRDLSLASGRLQHAAATYDTGDVRDPRAVRAAVAGARVVFVLAGPVGVDLSREALESHSRGLREVLSAVPADVRLVYTSSIVTVGASRSREPLDESSPFNLAGFRSGYVQAKRHAEEVALEAAARRDVVVVNPGYLFGPEDPGPSVMGRLCIRTWRGNIPIALPGGLNAVDVRDVAAGHLLAAERGRSGCRYILGGENVTHRELSVRLLAAAGRRRRVLLQFPGWLLAGAAACAEAATRCVGRTTVLSREYARITRQFWYCDSSRARTELGFTPRPLEETLADAFKWHAAHVRVAPRGLNRWLLPECGVPRGVVQIRVPVPASSHPRPALNLPEHSGIISK